jgi:DNA polymerase III alpha subunit (gram-positive type)
MEKSKDKKEKRKKNREEIAAILPKISSVNYNAVVDHGIVDKRFEREKASNSESLAAPTSSTFDAFKRMAAGLEGRTIAEKLADPTRPTWEQYKKENEDKLEIVGTDVKNMVEYRAQLDRDREKLLKQRHFKTATIEDSEDDEDSADQSSDDSDSHRNKKKKHKKEKKSKKRKKKSKKESKSSDESDREVKKDSPPVGVDSLPRKKSRWDVTGSESPPKA